MNPIKPEMTCLRIIASCNDRSGVMVNNIVRRSRLPVPVVDRALAGLRAAGHVSRSKVGYYTAPGYVATPAGVAALGGA